MLTPPAFSELDTSLFLPVAMSAIPTSFRTQAIVTHGDTHLSLTCRNLDLTATQKAFDNGNHAYAADDYTGAIESYTQALSTLRAELASVILLHRAAAYEMEHDYTSALRDVSQANPNDNSPEPDPYFVKGNVLTFQDDLKSAALVFKKGVDNVNVTHPAHPQLVKRHKQLLDEMDRRNRWMVNVLPYEVVSRILASLSFNDRHRLSQTCCFWRNFMLREWSPMWSTIDASEMPTPVHRTDSLLDMVPPNWVKKVKLDSTTETIFVIVEGNPQRIDSSDTVSGRIFKTMMEQKWNHIESLELSNINYRQLVNVIHLSRNTLKSLRLGNPLIHINHSVAAASFAVEACKHIQSIEIKIHHVPDDFANLDEKITLSSTTLFLTHLKLNCSLPSESMTRLLIRSPYLVSLALNAPTHADRKCIEILDAVYRHSPKLQELYYEGLYSSDTSLTVTYTKPDTPPDNDGLRVLHLESHYAGDADLDQILALLLKRSHNTLETLLLFIGKNGLGNYKALDMLIEHHAPSLKTLKLDIQNQDTAKSFGSKQFSHLLASCPSLKVVDLTGAYFWNKISFQQLGKLLRLEHLAMTLCPAPRSKWRADKSISSNAIEALFKGTPHLQQFHLALQYGDFRNLAPESSLPYFAKHIKNCPRVNELNAASVPFRNGQKLVQFLNNLKGSQIRNLGIGIECDIDERALEALVSIDNLGYLEVYNRGKTIDKKKLRQLFLDHHFNRLLVADIRYSRYDWVRLGGFGRSNLSTDQRDGDAIKRVPSKLVYRGRGYYDMDYYDSDDQQDDEQNNEQQDGQDHGDD